MTDRLIRIAPAVAVVAVAGAAAIISCQHAYMLVGTRAETSVTGRLLPFTVDGAHLSRVHGKPTGIVFPFPVGASEAGGSRPDHAALMGTKGAFLERHHCASNTAAQPCGRAATDAGRSPASAAYRVLPRN